MTAFISVIPILLLIVLMMGFKVSGYRSAIVTLIVTVLLALFAVPAMGIIPEKFANASIVGITCWSVVEGLLKACFPIILIIICAIFSYNILCETKEIETIKAQFIQMTSDKGLLVLLLTWGLGGVLEGMAGFGTAVAIPAAILIGLGFKPMFSAVICLVANTVAVGFGAVGLPATTLANQVAASGTATPEELCEVATFIILQLSLMFYITPFLILMMTDKTKILKNITIALFVGTCSIVVQFCASHPRISSSHRRHAAVRQAIPSSRSRERHGACGASKVWHCQDAEGMERIWTDYLFHPHFQQDCTFRQRSTQHHTRHQIRVARYWQYL